MNNAIYKYEVPIPTERFSIMMPRNAVILSVQTQREKPQIWALVDMEQPEEKRHFLVVGTGHASECLNAPWIHKFIGTFQLHTGYFVGHLFEIF